MVLWLYLILGGSDGWLGFIFSFRFIIGVGA
jgi:hypothetical protein